MLGMMGCRPDQTWQRADGADGLAQQLGWQSANDLMAFLAEGPEWTRLPQ